MRKCYSLSWNRVELSLRCDALACVLFPFTCEIALSHSSIRSSSGSIHKFTLGSRFCSSWAHLCCWLCKNKKLKNVPSAQFPFGDSRSKLHLILQLLCWAVQDPPLSQHFPQLNKSRSRSVSSGFKLITPSHVIPTKHNADPRDLSPECLSLSREDPNSSHEPLLVEQFSNFVQFFRNFLSSPPWSHTMACLIKVNNRLNSTQTQPRWPWLSSFFRAPELLETATKKSESCRWR